MIGELVIHAGDFKTGTTSIQAMLTSGNYSCAGGKIAFSPARGAHNALAKALYDKQEASHRRVLYAAQAAFFRSSDAPVGVISAEHYEMVEPSKLLKTIKEFMPELADTMRVVVYLRPHANRLVSEYSERTKIGTFSGTLGELFADRSVQSLLLYSDRLRRWRDVFGDRLIVRPMVRSHLKHQDVVHDFLDLALRGASVAIEKAPRKNPSLSLEDLAIIREMHKVLCDRGIPQPWLHLELGWQQAGVFNRLAQRGTATKPAMDQNLAAQVLDHCKSDAERLDADWFDDRPMHASLMQAAEGAIPAPQADRLEDLYGSDEIRTVRAFTRMLALTAKSYGLNQLDHLSAEAHSRAVSQDMLDAEDAQAVSVLKSAGPKLMARRIAAALRKRITPDP